MKILIVGAGGHGREVAEIVRHQAENDPDLSIVGFIDDEIAAHGDVRDGLPVLGGWSWFEGVDRAEVRVICAVGSPAVCRRLVQKARDLGLGFAQAISPLAYVSPRTRIGEGVIFFPRVVVNTGTHIGDHCTLNLAVTVSHDCSIGRYCNVNPGVHLAGNVSIGEGCFIGMGATVIQRRSIGEWTVVGAGAAVVQDLDARVTAVGVPARVIKRRSEHDHERDAT